MAFSREQILNVLRNIKHPETGTDVVSLGMVEDLEITSEAIRFKLMVHKKNDPLITSVQKACLKQVRFFVGPNIQVDVDVVHTHTDTHVEEENNLLGVKNIIAITSGKGGVGKSTIAVNIAVALAKSGYSVGLIDADVYGPSIPKMFNAENLHPEIVQEGTKEIIVPLEKYGVKILSIGFFVTPEQALIWRGPMATSALKQLLNQGKWGKLDYLLIDMPPGTGDVHLTLVQEVPVTGAIVVSTPQEVALVDAVKGIAMFRQDKINVPILGLVENMSWFTPAELPQNKYYLFGKEGVKKLSEKTGIPLLGQIPIVQSICEGSDQGSPSALNENDATGKAFLQLASQLVNEVTKRNNEQVPTRKVEIHNS